jgi:peptide/nickel transport system permease protein
MAIATTLGGATGANGSWFRRSMKQRPPWRRTLNMLPFILLFVIALIGPLLVPNDPTRVVGQTSQAPTLEFIFGTDSNGLDVFSRTVAATRLVFFTAISVAVLATGAGIALGLFVGMFENARATVIRWIAQFLSRALDLFQAIPVLIAGLVAVSFFGRNEFVITIALAAVLLPMQARLVRTEVLRVRSEAYVDAARMSGESSSRLIVQHVLPNSSAVALENSSAVFGMAIIFSAGLGFLGVGIPLPTPEWGSMIAIGAPDAAFGRWWPAFFPAVALCVAVWAASIFVSALFDRSKRA